MTVFPPFPCLLQGELGFLAALPFQLARSACCAWADVCVCVGGFTYDSQHLFVVLVVMQGPGTWVLVAHGSLWCCHLECASNRSEMGLELIQSGIRVSVEDRSAVDRETAGILGEEVHGGSALHQGCPGR